MIRGLTAILGPERAPAVRRFLAWSIAYGVAQGLALSFLVPVLRALLGGDPAAALPWLVAMAVAAAVTCVLHYVQAMQAFALALAVMRALHERLGDHVAALPLGWFSSERIGRLTRSAGGGTMTIVGACAHLLTPVVSAVTTPATIVVVMLVLDRRLGLAALACVPLLAVAFTVTSRLFSRTDSAVDEAAVLAGSRAVEFARRQPVLRAFGRSTEGYRPFADAVEAQRVVGRRAVWWAVPAQVVNGFAVQLTLSVIIVTGALLVLAGQSDVALVVGVIALGARFTGPLAEVGLLAGAVRSARHDLARLVEVLEVEPLPEPTTPEPVRTPGEVELRDVRFGYEPDRPVLDGVSFRVAPGTTTALVGPSGSGKSTITSLIARFADVDDGAVLVGGTDVRSLTETDLRAQVAIVFQDVYLFDDTLAANVRVGRPDAPDDDVAAVARLAGLDEVVARLPRGWQTPVGEGGTALSGGERQRVSIARALLKDAPVIMLDEATAALDPENAAIITRSMRAMGNDRTLVVVAHQLPTVVAADQILVLGDDGRIAERGRHDELLAAGGRYASFWVERRRARGWRIASPEPV